MTRPCIFVATSSKGKLEDFAAAAALNGVEVVALPEFDKLPEVVEDGATFEANARKKAIAYSLHSPGALVIADDSGLEVDALNGAPGLRSARFAAVSEQAKASDSDNNDKLLYQLSLRPHRERTARFVCVIAAARDGEVLGTFRGEAHGEILQMPLGRKGFGYDPLFYSPNANKTFAEMTREEKAAHSHRGAAFKQFLEWMSDQP
jgi:XTP/dITP diphosphohydrolase